ncbi:cupin domain-containing protein [Cupriavidus metallidurans]|uniref:Cupin domain-containing protein n=1 Tax=Cupriavidus metallidurans (strain ATCC 43123 / DSM 2839 / NBRC 102507 / CH34) TaxID=266264 RepID=Q1LBW1_CUPMC|nr:cupin domain-containing protein [Cupriavidus metallidurans]ABF12365.1 hypothetical protein Rmet_5506 [Cupriavidus metallidurans CH34]QGS32404.1 cupin domain-containing protein [Cupriavidus metallidurans]
MATEKTSTSSSEHRRPKRIQFFHAADAQDLLESGAMHFKPLPPERAELNPVFAQGVKEGSVSRLLFQAENGFSLVYSWFKSGFRLPAHSHDTDCLYYVISGEIRYGTQVLGCGDGFFVPAHTVYGYTPGPQGVEILEFRSVSEFDIELISAPMSAWERAAHMVQSSLERWRSENPPARASSGLG